MKQGDTVTLIAGRYIKWYGHECANHPYKLSANGRYKNYDWPIRNWQKAYDPDIVVRIPKFIVQFVRAGIATVSYEHKNYEIPIDVFEVLPNATTKQAA